MTGATWTTPLRAPYETTSRDALLLINSDNHRRCPHQSSSIVVAAFSAIPHPIDWKCLVRRVVARCGSLRSAREQKRKVRGWWFARISSKTVRWMPRRVSCRKRQISRRWSMARRIVPRVTVLFLRRRYVCTWSTCTTSGLWVSKTRIFYSSKTGARAWGIYNTMDFKATTFLYS